MIMTAIVSIPIARNGSEPREGHLLVWIHASLVPAELPSNSHHEAPIHRINQSSFNTELASSGPVMTSMQRKEILPTSLDNTLQASQCSTLPLLKH
jgi:hypothetical protein